MAARSPLSVANFVGSVRLERARAEVFTSPFPTPDHKKQPRKKRVRILIFANLKKDRVLKAKLSKVKVFNVPNLLPVAGDFVEI